MRPPQLILLLLCFILLPLLLTSFSLRSARPQRVTTVDSSSYSNRASRLRALFSFHAPSSLFPPSAIISLTDDNSTFFLARPAAFGPLLPPSGLSGQLWIGSGFGDDAGRKSGVVIGAEGELGCSDIPGWEEGDEDQPVGYGTKPEHDDIKTSNTQPKSGSDTDGVLPKKKAGDSSNKAGESSKDVPSPNDGTDDHLYRPKHPFNNADSARQNAHDNKNYGGDQNKAVPEHADIQSLQETAEITGKVVLLSRGGCGFLDKVKWVQKRGGIALVVGDNTRGGTLISMYASGDTSNITVPAVFTSHTTAHLLSSLIPPEKNSKDGKSEEKSKKGITNTEKQQAKRNLDGGTLDSAPLHKQNSIPQSKQNPMTASAPGFLRSIFSALGLGRDNAHLWTSLEESRRPPSSGNLHWASGNRENGHTNAASSKNTRTSDGQDTRDNFVIGVQDWRDPDLVGNIKSSTAMSSHSTPLPTTSQGSSNSQPRPSPNRFDGGSITPGSGEYAGQGKASINKRQPFDSRAPKPDGSGKPSRWWSGPLKRSDENIDSGGSVANDAYKKPRSESVDASSLTDHKSTSERALHTREHEGLWVTVTPTSISTSPFFDTLLVLVVSPLITLTVVYALLLLRSRIRRRRWRAPKAIVDRLPVRTYHTMQSNSNPTTPPQTATSEGSSPSSPLLSRAGASVPHVRSIAQPSMAASSNLPEAGASYGTEKSASGSSLWRRKYTGRQVECVVCLEEYVDGQSKVMSLPCGHEFHAECM